MEEQWKLSQWVTLEIFGMVIQAKSNSVWSATWICNPINFEWSDFKIRNSSFWVNKASSSFVSAQRWWRNSNLTECIKCFLHCRGLNFVKNKRIRKNLDKCAIVNLREFCDWDKDSAQFVISKRTQPELSAWINSTKIWD